jgi:5-methylcytosine-specific restriction protein A
VQPAQRTSYIVDTSTEDFIVKNMRPPLFRPSFQRDPVEAARARLAAWRKRQAEQEAARPTAAARGYDKDWFRVRALVLRERPWCAPCATRGIERKAEVVDHVQSISEAPHLRLERSNLMPMCAACHNGKTIRRDRGFGRPRRSP